MISTAMFASCKERLFKAVYDLDYGYGFMASVMAVVAFIPPLIISVIVPGFPPRGNRGGERQEPGSLGPAQTGPSARV